MSGMMRSIPGMFASGNITPASTTMMSLPYSITVMFLPISPTPPSGIMRSWGLATVFSIQSGPFYVARGSVPRITRNRRSKQAELLRRVLVGRGGRRLLALLPGRTLQECCQAFHVGQERRAQRLLVQRRGRMVHGKVVPAILLAKLSMNL